MHFQFQFVGRDGLVVGADENFLTAFHGVAGDEDTGDGSGRVGKWLGEVDENGGLVGSEGSEL